MKSVLTLVAAALLSSLAGASSLMAAPPSPQNTMPATQTNALAQPARYYAYYHGPFRTYYHGPLFSYYRGPHARFGYWHGPFYRYGYYGAAFYGYPAYGYYGAGYSPVGYSCRPCAHECAARWGWRTWRWGRCMSIHAC